MTLRALCVPGPTGAGKTAAAIALARAVGGGVVNFDSRQVFADFPVITAQPTAEERAACPHLLYGFLPTAESLSAGAYADLARQAVEETAARGMVPILVGGTGFYLRALLAPLAPIPPTPAAIRAAVQARWEEQGTALHEALARLDPTAAARIHPHDQQRVTRALEVLEATGRTLSDWHREGAVGPGWEVLKLGVALPAAALRERLAARITVMLAAGAVAEARAALVQCPDRTAPGWSGIGCAELGAHLAGEMDLDAACDLWLRNTRAYAKRQMTWFRRDASIRWFEPGQEGAMIQAARGFLSGNMPG
ncbi:MAG: tRNA (adenosine(37)-N6)-dimethylallyltransferase MiaA [Thermodesulfobacteriota bacterium]